MTTVRELARTVLALSDPAQKIAAIRAAHSSLLSKPLHLGDEVELVTAPAPCAGIVSLKDMEKTKEASKEVMLLHAIAHIEYNAMNLYWDMLGRFPVDVPSSYYTDFSSIACEEATHFEALDSRLRSLGSSYGSLHVHTALSSALELTSSHVLDRLVLTSLVHEARALDSHSRLRAKFHSYNRDKHSAQLLDWIVASEVSHVRTGLQWFRHFSPPDQKSCFQSTVRRVVGPLRPPFNVPARTEAGFPQDWYLPGQ